jgi:hypothetical protein
MMQTPLTGTPFNVCPPDGGLHEGASLGVVAAYEQPPPLQVPGDTWHMSGGLLQSALVQQFATGMQLPAHSLSPPGQVQPDRLLHCSPPVHGGAPLQVHPPAVHVLVVVLVQSPFVQHSLAAMQTPSHSLSPEGHAQPAAVHTCPPAQAMEPLHVHVPPLHVLVVVVVQSPLVQQLAEGMHDVPQSR